MILAIGDIFDFIRNGMSVKQSSDIDGLPITRIETIWNSEIDLSRVGYAGVQLADAKDYLLRDGDILFSHINSVAHIGKCALYSKSHGELVHGMNLLCFRPNQTKILPKYALYALRGRKFKDQLAKSIKKAVNQASVTISDIKKIQIEIPTLEEQQRIATILDRAELIKRKRELAVEKLDELAQSVFIEMFGDSVTNNKGWELKSLGEIADFYAGNSLPKESDYQNQSGGYFLMKVSDMNTLGNEREIKSCKSWSNVAGAKSATCPKGSIIIPKRGGAIGTNKKRITTRPTVLDPNLMAIKPKEEIVLTEYLFQWFLNFDLLSIANGSSVPQLNKKDLDPLRIQIPAIKAQEKFRNFIELHLAHKAKSINLMKREAMLFDSLKSKAFSGQL